MPKVPDLLLGAGADVGMLRKVRVERRRAALWKPDNVQVWQLVQRADEAAARDVERAREAVRARVRREAAGH